MRKAPYLGRIKLFWHRDYNIPLIKRAKEENVYEINLTPPGDVRPAFKGDVYLIKNSVDKLINGASSFFNYPILMNSISEQDRMDEIVIDGFIVGKIRFNNDTWTFDFFPSQNGAKALLGFILSKYDNVDKAIKRTRHVIVDSLAAEKIAVGKNVLAPGIIHFTKFREGDYVYLFSDKNGFIGVGRALVNSDDLVDLNRGTVIKRKIYFNKILSPEEAMKSYRYIASLREKLDSAIDKFRDMIDQNNDISTIYSPDFDPWKLFPVELSKYWKFIVTMNINFLKNNEKNAINFIHGIAQQYDNKKYLVSFSGGKDSCVVLELVIRSNIEFCTFFIDTGIELPETVNYVEKIIEKIRKHYSDEIKEETILDYKVLRSNHSLIVKVPETRFWTGVKILGYPAMDWRWCCKTNKLAPVRIITKKFLGEVKLSFGGIRRYESFQRSKEGKISKNIWTNQINIYPIYDWNALETWLYILWRRIPVNPLYGEGLLRIGCYPCPFSHMADFYLLKKLHPDLLDKIKRHIDYSQKNKEASSSELFKKGAWRWLKPPKKIGTSATLRRPSINLIKEIIMHNDIIRIYLDSNEDESSTTSIVNIVKTLLKDKVSEINLKTRRKSK